MFSLFSIKIDLYEPKVVLKVNSNMGGGVNFIALELVWEVAGVTVNVGKFDTSCLTLKF